MKFGQCGDTVVLTHVSVTTPTRLTPPPTPVDDLPIPVVTETVNNLLNITDQNAGPILPTTGGSGGSLVGEGDHTTGGTSVPLVPKTIPAGQERRQIRQGRRWQPPEGRQTRRQEGRRVQLSLGEGNERTA